MDDHVDTSDEACAVVCMLVSNPQGAFRKDGDGWQKRVNDTIRALRDERNKQRRVLEECRARIRAQTNVGIESADPENENPQHEFQELLTDLEDVLGQSAHG